MRTRSIISMISILVISACVDRINFDVEVKSNFPIVIDGFISDQPGPYTIKVSKAFDIDSKASMKTPASVKELSILDDLGNSEMLSEVSEGTYQSNANGMKGVVGRAYRLRVELLTGQVYESKPDTIHKPGKVDSVYYKFEEEEVGELGNTKYAFDIYFDASKELSNNIYFQWTFISTFKVITNAELDYSAPCGDADCKGCSICNFAVKCSGIRNIAKIPRRPDAIFIRFKPCECCTCWYNIFNEKPILSGNLFSTAGKFKEVKAGSVPVHEWIFQHKIYAEVAQRSLSHQAYTFFKAINDQKEAVNSLFQPISGKIASNFTQISGSENPIEGLFYATSVSSKAIIITKKDVPVGQTYIFPIRGSDYVIPLACTKLFPNSTTIKPSFWED